MSRQQRGPRYRHGLTNKLPKERGRDGMSQRRVTLVYVSKSCKALFGGYRHEEGQMSRSVPGLGGVSSRMASANIPYQSTDDKNENCISNARTVSNDVGDVLAT